MDGICQDCEQGQEKIKGICTRKLTFHERYLYITDVIILKLQLVAIVYWETALWVGRMGSGGGGGVTYTLH